MLAFRYMKSIGCSVPAMSGTYERYATNAKKKSVKVPAAMSRPGPERVKVARKR
jgi:hypothetical protein